MRRGGDWSRLVLEHPPAGIVVPTGLQASRALPVERPVDVWPLPIELPDRIRLGLHSRGVTVGWGRRPEFIRCREQDRLPVRQGHISRLVSDPLARPGRDCPAPDRVRAVGLCDGDHLLSNFSTQLQAGSRVARELDPGKDTRLCRLLGHRLERRRLVRKEVRENRGGGAGGRCMLGRIGGTPRRGYGSYQHRVCLARSGPVVEVLQFPRGDGGVVHRHSHVRVDAMCVWDRLVRKQAAIEKVDPSVGWRTGIPERDRVGRGRIVLCQQFPHLRQFARFGGRVRGWRDPKILARRDHPCLPSTCVRLNRLRLREGEFQTRG